MLSKTKTIAITAYKRPPYFERLLLSLIKNDLDDWSIYIQLEPSDKVLYFFEIAERLLKPYNYFIGVNSSVLGVKDNPYQMLDKIFLSGTLCCIYLEEDLVVSSDITKLANWYLTQDHQNLVALNLILGGCGSAGFVSNPSEPSQLIKTKSINSLGLVFTYQQWIQHIKPNWQVNPEYAINYLEIEVVGWDWALYDYVLSNPDLAVLQPICSRVLHLGEEDAVHTTSEFQQLAFSGLNIYKDADPLGYFICNNLFSFPYHVRSHVNLWVEQNKSLITLKKLKKIEVQLKALLKDQKTQSVELNEKIMGLNDKIRGLNEQIKENNITIKQILYSKSWRLTLPLRWLCFKFKSHLSWLYNT